MEQPRSFHVTSPDGIRLQCWQWSPRRPVVVAVHGMNAHGLHWRRLAERLSGRYSLVSYDLRGHGDSDKPARGYSLDDHAGDLAAVIEAVTSEPPWLIGHSLGARVAILHAARRAPRGLVIVDPGIQLAAEARPAGTTAPRRRRDLPFEYESEAAFMARMRRTNFLRNWSPYAEEYARNSIEPHSNKPDGVGPNGEQRVRLKLRPEAMAESYAAVRDFDALTLLGAIACPTLVVRATEGHLRADVAERMVEALPNGRLAVVEGANHNVLLDKPELFEPLIEEFLDAS